MMGLRINLGATVTFCKRPNHSPRCSSSLAGKKIGDQAKACREVVERWRDGPDRKPDTMASQALAAATSANLKRPVRVRLYPRVPSFTPALSCRHWHRNVSLLSWCGTTYCNT